mgnify:CR=1 FL=1
MEGDYTNKRLKEIAAVFVKHGIKNELSNPRQLRLALEELGPTFIKIGQLLSTRADILPIEYINELQKLQDNVKPEDFQVMKKVIEAELNCPLEEVFMEFNEKPIASASLSEVFKAKLKTGERVAVKVQRPFVKEKMLSDIKILKRIAPFINLTAPTKEVIDMREIVKELREATIKELNFLKERDNIVKFSENNRGVKFLTCPKVYKEYCTEKILVMDYIEGIKIDNIDRLKEEGYDTKDIAVKITYNYFKQVFEDGFFHADPHPGNILIHNNTISYLDFGLMGELDQNLRRNLNQLLEGIATNNIPLMVKALLTIGIRKGPIDEDKLYEDVKKFYNTYANQPIHNIDLSLLFDEVVVIAKNNNISMPHGIMLLAKGVVTLQAVISKIDEKMTLMDVAIPYFKDKIIVDRIKSLDFNEFVALLYSALRSTIQLPNKLLNVLDSSLQGRLKLYLELKNLEETFNNINKMVNRLIVAIIVTGLLISSSLVITANIGLKIHGISAIGIFGYISAGLTGILLLISIFRSGKL